MKSLIELLAEAQEILDKIAAHDDFVALLESEFWDNPAISLSDARQALEDLKKAQEAIQSSSSKMLAEPGRESVKLIVRKSFGRN